ncbi:hypothetical protein RB195_012416 [Necator americanus]|uniref:Uncharacterized protein n=1 Tax=Necator americanus TaxID=51031 RepID=A0ABR1D7P7_NECAM
MEKIAVPPILWIVQSWIGGVALKCNNAAKRDKNWCEEEKKEEEERDEEEEEDGEEEEEKEEEENDERITFRFSYGNAMSYSICF